MLGDLRSAADEDGSGNITAIEIQTAIDLIRRLTVAGPLIRVTWGTVTCRRTYKMP